MYSIYRHVVKQLIHRYGSDIGKLLTDETNDDFNAATPNYPGGDEGYNYPHPNAGPGFGGGYNYAVPNPAPPVFSGYNYVNPNSLYAANEDPIYIPKPR